MTKPTQKAAAFLSALSSPPPSPMPAAANTAPAAAPETKASRAPSRQGLKHIGGYFDRQVVEKIAVLRARLGLDNSQLIELAIDELYKKHEAKRAFGDA